MIGQRLGRGGVFLLAVVELVVLVSGGTTVSYHLNGPRLETSDLRDIDGYVSSTLPIFPKGFTLYNSGTGNRPIIVKNEDRTKINPQPDPKYYTDLPRVIPRGLEGIASTSFILGTPLNTAHGLVNTGYNLQQPAALQYFRQLQPQPAAQAPQPANARVQQQELAQPTYQIENSIAPNGLQYSFPSGRSFFLQPTEYQQQPQPQHRLVRNSVVEETSNYENTLPQELRNPFYNDHNTATSLAQESLPAPGEEIVQEWNTHKIQSGKVRDLLTGAGLI